MNKNFLVMQCDITALERTLNESVNPMLHEIITISIQSGSCVIVLQAKRPESRPYQQVEVSRPLDIGDLTGTPPAELRVPLIYEPMKTPWPLEDSTGNLPAELDNVTIISETPDTLT